MSLYESDGVQWKLVSNVSSAYAAPTVGDDYYAVGVSVSAGSETTVSWTSGGPGLGGAGGSFLVSGQPTKIQVVSPGTYACMLQFGVSTGTAGSAFLTGILNIPTSATFAQSLGLTDIGSGSETKFASVSATPYLPASFVYPTGAEAITVTIQNWDSSTWSVVCNLWIQKVT
jgi:hypothetical protein